MYLTAQESFRKELLPKWVRFFAWLFLLVGAAMPATLLLGIVYAGPLHFDLFGWEYNGSPYALSSLLILTYLAASGVAAFGLLWGRPWGWVTGLVVGLIGLALALTSMFFRPISVETPDAYSIHLRLEPLLQIPFIYVLWRVRTSWLSPLSSLTDAVAQESTSPLKIVIGLVCAVSLIVTAGWALLTYATSGLIDVAGRFLEAAKRNDIPTARSYLSEAAQAATDENALRNFLSKSRIPNFKAAHWIERHVSIGRGELKGIITNATGDSVLIELTFVKEGEQWKIFHLTREAAHPKPVDIEALRARAEGGDAEAQLALGEHYYMGNDVEKNTDEAASWFKQAAGQGLAKAEYNLAVMYDDGVGVQQDSALALEWYRKSADQGDAEAENNLAVMYEHGQGVQQDYAQALAWYRKAADQGYANAENNLAAMYDRGGRGVQQDSAQALDWYRKAANQGNANAEFNLALMYEHGQGVEQDGAQALDWYRKAAAQGLAPAQYKLAVGLSEGIGGRKDDVEAVRWYQKAASQDFSRAQNNLAIAYHEGKGIEKNDKEAYFWLLLSARSDENARALLEGARALLTPQESVEVEARVAKWRRGPTKIQN